VRIQVVEGHLKDGHDLALEYAAMFGERLQKQIEQPVELCVAGDVPPSVQARASERYKHISITFQGVVERGQIPVLDRSAHLLYCAEINPPCPNSVIEAMACGLPVAAFDTGSLNELVQGNAGRLAPFGANPWKMERPNFPALAHLAAEIIRGQAVFRAGARQRAEQTFDVQKMADGYLHALID
jgi:glycosyltransferase involved in cell wall biosynthesis